MQKPCLLAFSEGDEYPMTVCGGSIIGYEISRNEQCPQGGLATIEAEDLLKAFSPLSIVPA